MRCLFEEGSQFYLSLKSYQDTKQRNTLVFKCYWIIKFVYIYIIKKGKTKSLNMVYLKTY